MSESMIRQVMKAGVGRRIFALFLVAAILPMILTAGLAFFEVNRGLEHEAVNALRNRAKDYGMQILARLQSAAEKSAQVVLLVEEGRGLSATEHRYLLGDFEAIWEIDDDKTSRLLFGESSHQPGVDDKRLRALAIADSPLVLTAQDEFAILKSARRSNGQKYFLAFQLTDRALWGSRELLTYNAEYCVFSGGGIKHYCTADIDPSVHAALVSPSGVRHDNLAGDWQHNGEAHHAVLWQLFLQASFGAPAFDIVAIQPKVVSLQSGTAFRRIFIPAALLVLVLVATLSLRVINRSLGPLKLLTRASHRIAVGDFDSRVNVETGDEFERLGDAFNNMADRIGNQVSVLEAMSGIDRLILTGTKFEEVSENVVAHVIHLTGCKSAAVIARDSDDVDIGMMISMHRTTVNHERIEFPKNLHEHWIQPQQVTLRDGHETDDGYERRFREYGQDFLLLLPVVLNDLVKGIMVLGFDKPYDMASPNLKSCVDLASRFAVALSSVEREEALYQQAHFDLLTGLPNRQLLKDRLTQHIASAKLDSRAGAILFLDLDRFKEINDVFGHTKGDAVLKQAAVRIKSIVRENDTVARLGGDEFVVVLPNVPGNSTVRNTAKLVLEKLSEAFTVSGTDHYLSASIGITMFPNDGATVETLLKNADSAMYRAKEAGRGRFEFFSQSLNAESRRKIGIERDLRLAFHDGALEVCYQPQIDIVTGEICGAESLLRWTHPTKGPISPAEFVPLAEDSDLIVEIGSWVIQRVCEDLSDILSRGLHPGAVSINVSGRQLADTKFTTAVMQPIRDHGIHPGYIQMEVTETAVAQNRDRAISILRSLRDKGVRVAIDDFGTGYSSLSYLQQMPFDVIKIDKSFIDQIGSSEDSDNICCTIIKMAEQLGKKSIAEGVEKKSQLDFLRRNGCNVVQGYFYSKPLPKDEFLSFIEKQDFHTQRRKALEIL